jgi:hypothetical protein
VTESLTPVTARGWFRFIYGLKDRKAQDEALARVPANLKPIVRTMLNNQQALDRWRRKHDSLGLEQRNGN